MQDNGNSKLPDLSGQSGLETIGVRRLPKAREWSLVLISQGIESTIVPNKLERGWLLEIQPNQLQEALRVLEQYERENPRRIWKGDFLGTNTVFDWFSLVWVSWCVLFHWVNASNPAWLNAGGMDSSKVFSGQWWRLATALWLHADLAHLGQNMAIGFVLVGLAMGMYGQGKALMAAFATGVAGNALSLLLNVKPFHGLGASGLIMGCLGLIATFHWFPVSRHPSPSAKKWLLTTAASAVGLFLMLGTSPGTDFFAHLGGFASGLVIGCLHGMLPQRWQKSSTLSFACGVGCFALVVATWWLAWTHP